MSGMFKDKNGEPNVGLFFETEYPQSKEDMKAVSGSSDVSSIFKDLTEEVPVSDFYRQIPQPTTLPQPHSTITTSGAVEPNVGQFAGAEFDPKSYESSWESGESPADPHKTFPDVDGKEDVSDIYKDISKRAEEEINVGMFGPGGEEVGAYQTAWESANIAKEASKLAKEAIDKARNIDAQVSEVTSSRDKVEKIKTGLEEGLKDFGDKYTDLKTKVLPEVIRASNEVSSLETSAKTSAQTAASAKEDATKTLGTIKGVENQVNDDKSKIETYVHTVESLKSTIDKNTQDFINNYLNYRGLWNPASRHYPDAKGGNSVWDVDLTDGVSTDLFDGKAWSEGDRLFWYKIPVNGSNWVQLKSGSGIVVSTLDLLYQKIDSKNKPSGYAGLGADGKVLPSLMPALSVLDINVDENFYQRNSRTNLQKGDISIIKGAILWRPNQYYKKGDIIYIKDDAAPHELSKNKFHVSDKTFTSGDVFDHSHWLDTTFKTNHIYKVGDEFVYKTRLFIVKSKHTSGATLIDPRTRPSLYEQDTYLDAGMYILQRNPTGSNGSSVAEDWVSFGSDFRVQSFNGRVGTITPESGDYTSEEVVAKTFGSANVTNVQDFLEYLEASKVSRLGGQVSGKLSVKNKLEAENLKLTGLGEESITNSHDKTLLRSGGSGNATIVGNSSENTIIETKDSLLLDINGAKTKVYHEGFRPTPAEINALPNTWVPAWSDVNSKPETATRWPLWSEVTNKPHLFGGSYLELKDVPSTFAPSTHSHPWDQIRGIPVEATRWPIWGEISGQPATATRWPSWNEVTGKPTGILNQGSYDQRYLLKGETAVNALKLNNVSLDEFFDQDGGSGQAPARIKLKNTDDGKWLHITRRDGQYFSLEQSDTRDAYSASKTFFTINSSGVYYNPTLGDFTGTGYRMYHEGFKPTASDVKARPDNWVPSWSQVTSKPDTAIRWPFWREIPDKPNFFSGNYKDLADKPTSFTPSAHRHPWSQIDGIPESATRWGSFNDITNKPETATRWPKWSEVEDKPTDHLTQGRTGSYLQGLILQNTSTGTKAKYPLTIRRITSDREKLDIFVNDTNATFDYTNDETGSSLLFNITNTGLEGNNQADANKGTIKFDQSINGTFILINGKKVYTEGYKPTANDTGAHPNTWKPSWSEVTSKPAQATRWPTWAEVTGKPTNYITTGSDAVLGSSIIAKAGTNQDASLELNEDNQTHGIRIFYRGSGDNLGLLQGKNGGTYKDIAKFPRSGGYFNAIGQLQENGIRVYSPNNKPSASTLGVYTKAETDAKYLPKTGKAVSAGVADSAKKSIANFSPYKAALAENPNTLSCDVGGFSYTYNHNLNTTNLFPTTNNANSILTFNRHGGEYYHQLGFSSNGATYVRGSRTGRWGKVYTSEHKPTPSEIGAYTKDESIATFLVKGGKAVDSAKLEGKSKAQVVAEARSGLATTASSDSKYFLKTGGTITGDITISKTNGKLILNETNYSKGNSGIEFKNSANQNVFMSHEISDNKLPAPGQAIQFKSSGTSTTTHVTTDGEFFAQGTKKVYHTGNNPSAGDVGAYTKAETNGRYLGKTAKAADSDRFDGRDSSVFVYGSNGFAINQQSDFVNNRKSGFVQMSNTIAKNKPGRSDSWVWGWQASHSGNGSSNKYGSQFVINQDNKAFFRVQSSSGAGTWRELYHTGFNPTAADVGALTKVQGDGYYLGKTSKAIDSSKLEGKTKAQVVAEARRGLAGTTYGYSKAQADGRFWKRSEKVANATTSDTVGTTNLGKTASGYLAIPNNSWWGNTGIGHSQMIRSGGEVPVSGGYAFKFGARDVAKGHAWLYTGNYNSSAGLWYGVNADGTKAPIWDKIFTKNTPPTSSEVGAYSKAESNSRFAYKAGSKDQDFSVKKLNFKSGSSDYANISTTISGSSTHLDFNLSDDANGNDKFRFRFTPTGGTGTYSIMELYEGSDVKDGLGIAKINAATSISGDVNISRNGNTRLKLNGTSSANKPELLIGEQDRYAGSMKWDSGLSIDFLGYTNKAGLSEGQGVKHASWNTSTGRWSFAKTVNVTGGSTIAAANIDGASLVVDGSLGFDSNEMQCKQDFYIGTMANSITIRTNGSGERAKFTSSGLNVVGQIKEGGQRVYSPNNKPTFSDVLTPYTTSKDLALTANTWTKLLGKSDGLNESGVYQILVSYHSSGKGGVAYYQNYTGQFFWYASGTNQVDESEITLHNMGHADNSEFIYLRTATKLGNKGDQEVQILCNRAISKAVTFTVKLVRLM